MSFRQYILFIAVMFSFTALGQIQRGKASFYAKEFTGRRTASGERLHHDSLTCAHRTYPFGTLLKVTNPANGNNVVVRVTDRGPFVRGRIIDLSVRAARELGIIAQGIASVVVERYTGDIVPPFKVEEVLDLPDLELGTNEDSDGEPIWVTLREERERKMAEQKAKEIEEMQRKKAQAAANAVVQPEPSVVQSNVPASKSANVTPTKTSNTISADQMLDDISNKPNKSKAYLKRQGR